jgi:superfamily II DNA or RNA helicase
MEYESFVARKLSAVPPTGIESPVSVSPLLKPHQRDGVGWALRRGRGCLFEDTGLGKTLQELEWARHVAAFTGRPVLILAPLAVASQTAREGRKFGIDVTVCREQADVRPGVNVTNYERLHRFDPSAFGGVVLDESSILKSYDGRTRTAIIEAFAATPFKLACTATPAPNDHVELGNHAEFLGVMTRTEMLATFFCHDGGETQTWRLKGHAEEAFWKWVCSWALCVRKPSDLGHSDEGYDLPGLDIVHHTVATEDRDARGAGLLFALPARSLTEQRAVRRGSLEKRVARVADLVAAEPGEPWVVWCELNDEGDALTDAIHGAVQVSGSDSAEEKERRLVDFAEGRTRVVVTKGSIAGFGLNWQHCARTAFVGVTHSYEGFYQSVRRFYRFGQARRVVAHVVSADLESEVVASLKRKEADAARMGEAMVAAMRATQIANVRGLARESDAYGAGVEMRVPGWIKREVAA